MPERLDGPQPGLPSSPQTLADWRRQNDEAKLMLFLTRFTSAEALGKFLDEHDRMRERLKAFDEIAEDIEKLIEEQERREWLFRASKSIATWMIAITAGIAAFKGFFSDFLSGGGKP